MIGRQPHQVGITPQLRVSVLLVLDQGIGHCASRADYRTIKRERDLWSSCGLEECLKAAGSQSFARRHHL
jgi:hypothetical protein